MTSYEQKARDMLERCGWKGAQRRTASDVVEVANLLVERDRLKKTQATLLEVCKAIVVDAEKAVSPEARQFMFKELKAAITKIEENS
jgi:hypothetical protein